MKATRLMLLLLSLFLLLTSCVIEIAPYEQITEYAVEINNNIPEFTPEEITTESFELYSELDYLGRCGMAFACIGEDIMPTEERESIGQVKPSGWQIAKYDIVDGKYLYNRCHLIGFQLTGENANEKNLITGTRSMNVDGMLPYENMVDDYIEETGNHVMYRVTPIFEGTNLVAKGVQMEALSVEDGGAGISFNVFIPNTQPGIEIDYSDGSSCLIEDQKIAKGEEREYVLNTSSKKIHYPDCSSVSDISKNNKKSVTRTIEELLDEGYKPCGVCKP